MKSHWETLDTIFVELKKFYFILKKKKKKSTIECVVSTFKKTYLMVS